MQACWHKPLFGSGSAHGSDLLTKDFWEDLYHAHATIVLNGHDSDYERFAQQDPDAKPDPAHGIRKFVVGTGGKSPQPFGRPVANGEIRNADTYGVLELTLHPKSFDWEFNPEARNTFRDSGSGSCNSILGPVSHGIQADTAPENMSEQTPLDPYEETRGSRKLSRR